MKIIIFIIGVFFYSFHFYSQAHFIIPFGAAHVLGQKVEIELLNIKEY